MHAPSSNIAEWHITYRCNLSCTHCSRLCFLPPTTPDMTLEDVKEFVRQAKEMNWKPLIRITGGEATLHHDFFAILEIANEIGHHVELWSNGYSSSTKQKLEQVKASNLATIIEFTQKPDGSVRHNDLNYFIAPVDFNNKPQSCGFHSHMGLCGISVDSCGYTVCPVGGAIDSVLALGLRTRRLADVFDPAFVQHQTDILCSLCGHGYPITTEHVVKSHLIYDTLMSQTWYQAVRRIYNQQ